MKKIKRLSAGVSRRVVLAGIGATVFAPYVRAAEDKVVRVWSQFDPKSQRDPREKVYAKLISEFEAANPGVKIVSEPQIWYQMTDKFFAAHRTGTAPDIVTTLYHRLPTAVDMGALANLDDLFAANKLMTPEDYADLSGPYFDFGMKDGKRYQIEHSRSIVGILYHTELLQKAGINPASIMTWDDLLAAARELTEKNGSQVTRHGFGQVFTTVANQPSITASMIMDRDGSLLAKDGKAAFATPTGIEGLTFATDLIRKHNVAPASAISLSGEDLFDVFTSGRAAMILSNSGRIARLRGILKNDNVDFMPLPGLTKDKRSPTEAQGWPWTIWSGSKVKDEAAKFLAYMSSKEADKMWVMEGGAIPIRKSTVSSNPDFFKDPAKGYITRVAETMQKGVWFTPKTPVGGWNEELDKAGQAVLGKNTDVKAALQAAEQSYNSANGA
jgi:multiple sugar transport system substrate-binding protein